MRIFKFPIILCAVFLTCVTSTRSDAQPALELSDSLLLLENILKDIEIVTEGTEQYKLFMRAETTYKEIKRSLSDREARKLYRKLAEAFKALIPPDEIVSESNISFSKLSVGSTTMYVSVPIENRLFVQFLNDEKVPFEDLKSWIHPRSRVIHWDQGASQFTCNRMERPITGANYTAVARFISWLSRKERISYMLPDAADAKHESLTPASCWTRSSWVEKDVSKQESREMFGGNFHTLMIEGEALGALPEACYPNTEIRLMTSPRNGKKIYLKRLKTLQ